MAAAMPMATAAPMASAAAAPPVQIDVGAVEVQDGRQVAEVVAMYGRTALEQHALDIVGAQRANRRGHARIADLEQRCACALEHIRTVGVKAPGFGRRHYYHWSRRQR